MKLSVNGKSEDTKFKTVMDYVLGKGLDPKSVIVEYNLNIIKRDTWNKIELKNGDRLEVLNFVGGG